MKKVIIAVLALLLTVSLCLMATGSVSSFLLMERPTQWLIFLGMASVTIILWVRLLVIWRHRAAKH